MKKILLMTIISLMALSFAFSDTTSSGAEIKRDRTAHLKLQMESVVNTDFGLSSRNVDRDNPPVPIQENGIVSLSSDGEIDHVGQTLHGSGRAWAYWDIASPDNFMVTLKLGGAMTAKSNTGKTLDWCCYFTIDGTEYYLGKYDKATTGWQNKTTITTLIGKEGFNDDNSYTSLYYDYNQAFILYDDTNEQSVPFWRIDGAELHFYTDNAYPSDSVPADVYTGSLVMELTTY